MTVHPTLDAIRGVLAEHPDLETWVGHFEMRVPELAEVERLAGFVSTDRVLEVGCGNGLSAAYFAPLVASLVATDLPEEDPGAHSIGLDRAVDLMATLGLSNVTVEGASAVDLPFPDAPRGPRRRRPFGPRGPGSRDRCSSTSWSISSSRIAAASS